MVISPFFLCRGAPEYIFAIIVLSHQCRDEIKLISPPFELFEVWWKRTCISSIMISESFEEFLTLLANELHLHDASNQDICSLALLFMLVLIVLFLYLLVGFLEACESLQIVVPVGDVVKCFLD